MEGLRVTRASLRIMTLLARSLQVCPGRLRSAFAPGVFATDRALELVAGGMPFRDAYRHVRENLDSLALTDPARAVAAKTHEGGTAGLDFGYYRGRISEARRIARARRRRSDAAFARLLGTSFPLA